MHSVCAPFAGISLSMKCVFTFPEPLAIHHLTAGPRAAQHTHFGLFVLSRRRTMTHWWLSSKHIFRNGSAYRRQHLITCARLGLVLPWMWEHDQGDRLSTVSQVRAVLPYLGTQADERWHLAVTVSLLRVCDLAVGTWGAVGQSPERCTPCPKGARSGPHPAQNCRGDSHGSVELGWVHGALWRTDGLNSTKCYWNHCKEEQS